MRAFKELCQSLLCLFLLFLLIKSSIYLEPVFVNLIQASERFSNGVRRFDNTVMKAEKAVETYDKFVQEQYKKFNDKETQDAIGLYLRGGKPYYRAILKANDILAATENIVVRLDKYTVNKIEQAIDEFKDAIHRIAQAEGGIIPTIEEDLKLFTALLKNEAILQALLDFGEIAKNSKEISSEVKLTVKDLKDGLKEATKILLEGLGYGRDAVEQLKIALKKFNEPLTSGQKIIKFLAEALGKSLPALLRR